MTKETGKKVTRANAQKRRTGVAGILVGAIALLACELPIILAFVGLGGLSASAISLRPPLYVEVGGVVLILTGSALLIWRAIKLKHNKQDTR